MHHIPNIPSHPRPHFSNRDNSLLPSYSLPGILACKRSGTCGGDAGVFRCKQGCWINAKRLGKIPDNGDNHCFLLAGNRCLFRSAPQTEIVNFAPDKNFSTMDTAADTLFRDGSASPKTENDDKPSSHILAEICLCGSPDNEDRTFFLVLLHVDAPAVADIVADIHPASPHAMGHGISGTAMDDDFSLIHGITGSVICISLDNDCRATHEHCKVATRYPIYRDGHIIATQPVTDKALAEDIVNNNLFGTARNCSTDLLVERSIMEVLCINPYGMHPHAPTVL